MKTFDLQRFRRDNNLTQKQIAKMLECEQPFISKVEKRERLFPESMQAVLQSEYGDITEYITEIDGVSIPDATPSDLLFAGADAFSRQLVAMMNDKLIAPYSLLEEKDKEIERLNREVGKLQTLLEMEKKTAVHQDGGATCADVG